MASNRETFTPESARHFDRYSVANAVAVKQSLPCGCEPYRDVFTYLRWKAQGFQVQRGQKAIKLPLIYGRTESDPETGEARTVKRVGRSAVFCRCQVKAIEARGADATREPSLGNCSSCGGWGRFAGGRPCRRCDGTGSVAECAPAYVASGAGFACVEGLSS